MRYYYILLLFFGCKYSFFAQKDFTYKLNGVIVKGYRLKKNSKGFNISCVSDSLIAINNNSLTDVLRFNSLIYFKEYGNNMLSSPSFRGTSASHTAVLWNGININSQLNGQTDFNTIALSPFQYIYIKSGGGSVFYGTGAIGGSIHINNEIKFKKQFENKILLSVASFNSFVSNFSTKYSTPHFFLNLETNYNESENRYFLKKNNFKNENGEFSRTGLNANFGIKINSKNWLKIFTNSNFSNRNIARSLNAPSRSKLKNKNYRSLIELNSFISKKTVFISKIAYLLEEYKYFEDRFYPSNFSSNKASTFFIGLNFQKELIKNFYLTTKFNIENVKGSGDNLQNKKRKVYSLISSINHKIFNFISYSAQIRKDFSSSYNTPFLFSLGAQFNLTKNYNLLMNFSKNFRQPSLNDLFWKGSGNINLQPEKSYQIELGNKINYKNLFFELTGFYIHSNNLIQWQQNSNTGLWFPQNILRTKNYGLETKIKISKKINNNFFNFKTIYSLTYAKNIDNNTDLIYVPRHKINLSSTYNNNKFLVYYQQLINGKVNVFSDKLPGYLVANAGIQYKFGKNYKLLLKVNNIFNNSYQSYQFYPNPPINYQIQLQLNI